MKSMTLARSGRMVLVAALLVMGVSTGAHAASNTKGEAKCFDTLTKSLGKHLGAVSKADSKCIVSVLKGKSAGPCPDTKTTDSIDKSAGKTASTVAKKCKSTCNLSGLECIDTLFCPPNGAAFENCSAGGSNVFSMTNMGFPGPYCEAIIGEQMIEPTQFGECMAGLGETLGNVVTDNVFGDYESLSGLSKEALKCLIKVSKGLAKSASKIASADSKCRASILTASSPLIAPDSCATSDAKTLASINKETGKFAGLIAKACTDSAVAELDLCGAGVGGVTSVVDAQTCLGEVLEELSNSIGNAEDRPYTGTSIINGAYPDTAAARCGDNLVNQLPSQFALLGEECDGTDDAACPGECFPPGDLWECTCGDIPRVRSFADGFAADLDNGWSGASHNAAVTDGAGFITTVENCDCDEFDPMNPSDCVEALPDDPVCDVFGEIQPRCTHSLDSGMTCDQVGLTDGKNENLDCQVCDQFSANEGVFCANDSQCDSQCYDADGMITGPCDKQADCADGERCRGRCDKQTYKCLILRNGAPLPLSAQGTSVCIDSQFATNATGTRNIVTGDNAIDYNLRSVTVLAQLNARPCPVCGGWCSGPGNLIGERCNGTCTGMDLACRGGVNIDMSCTSNVDCPGSTCHGKACRFDDDCSMGETCTAPSPECQGQDCVLDLICAGGSPGVDGQPCRIESYTAFGTTSGDCPPPTAQLDISGGGLSISWTPLTTEAVALESPGVCDAVGYQNFDCFCVTGGGDTRTQPNRCDPACTAGANFGMACSGLTKCVGGTEQGAACDESSDCSGGGTCTGNPGSCSGGSNPGAACNVGIAGTCLGGGVCAADQCPTGICTPLCLASGECSGGTNDGGNCATDVQCPGGGTCNVVDTEEGYCAAGTFNHCDGPGHEFRTCTPGDVGTQNSCEAGTADNIVGNVNDFVGAGYCIADVKKCFYNGGAAEGGGTPTHNDVNATYCIAATANSSVNATAGLPGPGRIRQPVTVLPNFTTLP